MDYTVDFFDITFIDQIKHITLIVTTNSVSPVIFSTSLRKSFLDVLRKIRWFFSPVSQVLKESQALFTARKLSVGFVAVEDLPEPWKLLKKQIGMVLDLALWHLVLRTGDGDRRVLIPLHPPLMDRILKDPLEDAGLLSCRGRWPSPDCSQIVRDQFQ